MMYDIEFPGNLADAIRVEERKLAIATRERDALMVIIQASRDDIPGLKLTTDGYIGFKIAHGNAEQEAHRAEVYLRAYRLMMPRPFKPRRKATTTQYVHGPNGTKLPRSK
jgi:hypothetical protein